MDYFMFGACAAMGLAGIASRARATGGDDSSDLKGRKTLAPDPKPDVMPMLRVSGTRHAIGLATGKHFRDAIHRTFHGSEGMKQLVQFVRTAAGRAAFEAVVDASGRWAPGSVEEIRGLAEGSGMTEEQLWLINTQKELRPLAAAAGYTATWVCHCSDVAVPAPAGKGRPAHFLHGHNEDGGLSDLGDMYMMYVRASNADGSHDVSYVALNYPGKLSSGAFWLNEHGLYLTTNALFPTGDMIGLDGHVGIDFLQRRAISCKTLDEAVELLRRTKLASGTHVNIGSFDPSDGRLFSLELCSRGASVVEHKSHPAGGRPYWHFNQYQRPPPDGGKVGQSPWSTSSQRRRVRVDALPPPMDARAILNALGDTADAEYPIYRDAAPPDDTMTICTFLMDLHAGTTDIYMNNPREGERGQADGPLLTLRWPEDVPPAHVRR